MARLYYILVLCLVGLLTIEYVHSQQVNSTNCENCGARQYLEDLKSEYDKLLTLQSKLTKTIALLNSTNSSNYTLVTNTRKKQLDKVNSAMSLLAIEMNVIGDVCSRFEGSNCDSGCKVGWMGSSCNIPTPYCFGIIASNATVCNSKGSCVSNNTCVCRAGYSGSDCNSACPSSLSHYYPLKSDLLDAVGTNNLKYVSTAPTFSNYAGRMSLYCDSTTNYLSNSIMYWDSSAQVEGKTISVWVNRESGTGIPFGMGNHYYIEFDIAGSNGNAGFTFHDYNNNAILTSPTQYPAGVWKHYVIVFRSDGTDLYVDGSLAKSVTSPVYANSGYFNVCGHTNYFKGHVADFKIFSKVLTSSEVNALYSC